jgi:hypothetical protein
MAQTIWSRERHQHRATHRSHEQIQLLRTIARVEAALQDGPQVIRVTRTQHLVLEDMDVAWSSPLSPQEKLSINRILEEVLGRQFEIMQRRTGAANE